MAAHNCKSQYSEVEAGRSGRRSAAVCEVQGPPGLCETPSHLLGFIYGSDDSCLGPILLTLQYCEQGLCLVINPLFSMSFKFLKEGNDTVQRDEVTCPRLHSSSTTAPPFYFKLFDLDEIVD